MGIGSHVTIHFPFRPITDAATCCARAFEFTSYLIPLAQWRCAFTFSAPPRGRRSNLTPPPPLYLSRGCSNLDSPSPLHSGRAQRAGC